MKCLSSGWVVGVDPLEDPRVHAKSSPHLVFFHPTEKNTPLRLVVVGLMKTFEGRINGREYEWTKEWASGDFSEVFFHPTFS